MNLSKYFTLEEMTFSEVAARYGIPNNPGPKEMENLRRLCAVLDQVRDLLGHPVMVSSGFRCVPLNTAVNGAKNSAHVKGLAADIRCPGYGTPLQVCRAIQASGIGFDQVIHEFGRWCHIGLSDVQQRREALTINEAGTQRGLV